MAMEKFHFTHNDKEYTLPWISGLKVGLMTELMEAMDVASTKPHVFFKAVMKAAGAEAGEALADMEQKEFFAVTEAWIKNHPGAEGK